MSPQHDSTGKNMYNRASRWVAVLPAFLLALFTALPTHAEDKLNITKADLSMLPRYCVDKLTQEGDTVMFSRWSSVMGHDFLYMHHHCYGLIHMTRAYRPGLRKIDRDFQRQKAINEFEFVIEKAKNPDFIMLPEVFSRRGEAMGLLGDTLHAEESFEEAARRKADYASNYGRWAEMWIARGNRDKAKAVIERGFKNSADSKHLRQLAKLLGVTSQPAPPKTEEEDEKEAAATTEAPKSRTVDQSATRPANTSANTPSSAPTDTPTENKQVAPTAVEAEKESNKDKTAPAVQDTKKP